MSGDALDRVLALQLLIAWAGEGLCEPARLGWWRTDLVDAEGGGDFLRRLAPRTHAWASLEAALEAARRVDRACRREQRGRLITLFSFGPPIDEALSARLRARKRLGQPPSSQLSFALAPLGPLDRAELEQSLARGSASYEQEPGRRRVIAPTPLPLLEAAESLASALLPLTPGYPAPYLEAEVIP